MPVVSDLSRRTLLGAPALLSVAGATAACAQSEIGEPPSGATTLVAYFTRSGNTRVIAGQLHRDLPADLFEIRPAQAYPEDYEQTVEQARQERDRGYAPPLAESAPGFEAYRTVYLGFPIWGGTAPPVIRAFLRGHDMTGKHLRPFITHGGYGPGDSEAVIARHAAGARIDAPFVIEADQERRTMTAVRGWLDRSSSD
ncbi:flavodoxin [Brevundimonas sp.]|jgi:flavodoxin|uniref:flavodoxin n=1 Tax=Brevundimonas sp. TaxID=1871086 RepID=UPI0037C08DE4